MAAGPKKAAVATPEPSKAGGKLSPQKLHALLMLAIALVTWVVYQVCLDNQLTNWDDPGYVRDNALVKNFSSGGIVDIFTTSIMGNYHPLTILTYAIEYSFVRLEPWLYHLDSVLLHIAASLLVYWLVYQLLRRHVAAVVTALLFALHPMHVESVAWIASRKDVVYAVFFLASCIAHIYYVDAPESRKTRWYAAALLLYVCSLLGKPVAVVLPVTLLAIDYYKERPMSWKWLIEKIPHFLLAVLCGIRSVSDQAEFGSLNTLSEKYNMLERLALGAYALTTYLWKAILPINLVCFYPYPLKENGSLQWTYYLYIIAVAAVVAIVWRFGRKNKQIVFGIAFFIINIALLLQFIPVGGAILAERYTYIPYLGLFFIVGWAVSEFAGPGSNASPLVKKQVLGALAVYLLVLGYWANDRCKVWYDTATLWTDEIAKEPDRAPNAYNNLGFHYFNKFSESVVQADRQRYYDSSYQLLIKAISLVPTFVNPHISLGELLRSAGKHDEAKIYYYKALALKSFDEKPNAYLGLAIIYSIAHNFDSAAFCFQQAVTMKPHFPEAHSNYGNFFDMTRRPDSALVQYGIAIAQNPDMYAPFLNRGRLLQRMGKLDEAMNDFEAALQQSPTNGEIYYGRSFCHASRKNYAAALQDIEKARSLGFTDINPQYYAAMKGGR